MPCYPASLFSIALSLGCAGLARMTPRSVGIQKEVVILLRRVAVFRIASPSVRFMCQLLNVGNSGNLRPAPGGASPQHAIGMRVPFEDVESIFDALRNETLLGRGALTYE